MFRFTRSNGITEGWRKEKAPVKLFLTTGDGLLACKLVTTTRGKRYKPSDRSELAIAFSQSLRARNIEK